MSGRGGPASGATSPPAPPSATATTTTVEEGSTKSLSTGSSTKVDCTTIQGDSHIDNDTSMSENDEEGDVSFHEGELLYLIQRYLSQTTCVETAATLQREVVSQSLLPPRTDWQRGQHSVSWNEMAIRHPAITPRDLPRMLERLLTTAQQDTAAAGTMNTLLARGPNSIAARSSGDDAGVLLGAVNRRGGREAPAAKAPAPTMRQLLHRSLKVTPYPSMVLARTTGAKLSREQHHPVSTFDKMWQLKQVHGHFGDTYVCMWDHTGRRLITGGDDALVKTWAVRPRTQLLRTHRGHALNIIDCAVSPDNKLIAAISNDQHKVIRVWNLHTGHPVAVLAGHAKDITCVHFNPSLKRHLLLSASEDGTVRLWHSDDWNRNPEVITPPCLGRPLKTATFNTTGTQVLVGVGKGRHQRGVVPPSDYAYIYGLVSDRTSGGRSTYRLQQKLHCHVDSVMHAMFSKNSEMVATGGQDGLTYVWHLQSGTWRVHHALQPWTPPTVKGRGPRFKPPTVDSMAWAADDAALCISLSDNAVYVYDPHNGALLRKLEGHSNSVYVLDAHPYDGRIIFTASYDGSCRIWDISTGTCIKRFGADLAGLPAVLDGAWSPTGDAFAVTDASGTVSLYGFGSIEHQLIAPREQFFEYDYQPLRFDMNGHVLDATRQVPPHTLVNQRLVMANGEAYPAQVAGSTLTVTDVGLDPADYARVLRDLEEREREETLRQRAEQMQRYGDDSDVDIGGDGVGGDDAGGSDSDSEDGDSHGMSSSSVLGHAHDDDDDDDDHVPSSSQYSSSEDSYRSGSADQGWGSRTRRSRRNVSRRSYRDMIDSSDASEGIQEDNAARERRENRARRRKKLEKKKRKEKRKERRAQREADKKGQRRRLKKKQKIHALEGMEEHLPFGKALWSTATAPIPGIYIPQEGDQVFYFRQGHLELLKVHGDPDGTPAPWELIPTLRAVERCRIQSIKFDVVGLNVGHPLLCCTMRLELLDVPGDRPPQPIGMMNALRAVAHASSNGKGKKKKKKAKAKKKGKSKAAAAAAAASATSMTFHVHTYYPTEAADFLVLAQRYEAAVAESWMPGDRFKMFFPGDTTEGGVWAHGTVAAVTALDPALYPDSPWESVQVGWDIPDADNPMPRVSPWEMVPEDSGKGSKGKGKARDAPGPNATTTTTTTSTTTTTTATTTNGSGSDTLPSSDAQRIGAVIEGMLHDGEWSDFAFPVNLNDYPLYSLQVGCPMDLSTVSQRLRNGFYRGISGVKQDIRQIGRNAHIYNEAGSEITRKADELVDELMRVCDGATELTNSSMSAALLAYQRHGHEVISRDNEGDEDDDVSVGGHDDDDDDDDAGEAESAGTPGRRGRLPPPPPPTAHPSPRLRIAAPVIPAVVARPPVPSVHVTAPSADTTTTRRAGGVGVGAAGSSQQRSRRRAARRINSDSDDHTPTIADDDEDDVDEEDGDGSNSSSSSSSGFKASEDSSSSDGGDDDEDSGSGSGGDDDDDDESSYGGGRGARGRGRRRAPRSTRASRARTASARAGKGKKRRGRSTRNTRKHNDDDDEEEEEEEEQPRKRRATRRSRNGR